MYTRFYSRRLCRIFVSSSFSRGNRHVPTSYRRPSEITFNRPCAGSLTRTLYSSNTPYRETDSANPYENGMAFKVSYKELREAQKDANVLIVDVREHSEINQTGALPGSIHIPMDNVCNEFSNLSEEEFLEKYGRPKPTKDTKIIFSCQSGRRSANVQARVQELGYTQAYNYTGGWSEWEQKVKNKSKK
ncbi:rhodanese domain-containing protein CG4456 [Monomorium pharaonis]|uniref:rhodanese domain-containing protein CG4456 n=1 Tax=Monomorium pharaonis TaxID=307658 RepID=UPI00063EF127|nr:rhodanese domain-containing protein CG4456 [Monomorium pharaonis]